MTIKKNELIICQFLFFAKGCLNINSSITGIIITIRRKKYKEGIMLEALKSISLEALLMPEEKIINRLIPAIKSNSPIIKMNLKLTTELIFINIKQNNFLIKKHD